LIFLVPGNKESANPAITLSLSTRGKSDAEVLLQAAAAPLGQTRGLFRGFIYGHYFFA
jgi:hypothetical protein